MAESWDCPLPCHSQIPGTVSPENVLGGLGVVPKAKVQSSCHCARSTQQWVLWAPASSALPRTSGIASGDARETSVSWCNLSGSTATEFENTPGKVFRVFSLDSIQAEGQLSLHLLPVAQCKQLWSRPESPQHLAFPGPPLLFTDLWLQSACSRVLQE